MSDEIDSEGKRIPEGWGREEWEALTSFQRAYYRTGMTVDGGTGDD